MPSCAATKPVSGIFSINLKTGAVKSVAALYIGHEFYTRYDIMDKIKNGDAVLYKNLKGTIYGKPRENKYKGLLYTVKIGDEYVKASASELTLNSEESHSNDTHLFMQHDRR